MRQGTLPVMATKRAAKKAAVPTKTITGAELILWLKGVIGETKHEAFAAEIGVSRQVLSGVISGRRAPGPNFCGKLKRYGLVGFERVYLVVDTTKKTEQK